MNKRLAFAAMAVSNLCFAAPPDDLLPTRITYTSQEQREKFYVAELAPLGDPRLNFEIVIANDWQSLPFKVAKEEVAHDDEQTIKIAEFRPKAGKGKDGVFLQVWYMRVPESVSRKEFVDLVARELGYTIVQRRESTALEGQQFHEALMKRGSELMRYSVLRRGNLVFAISATAPEVLYADYKQIFAMAVGGFALRGKPAPSTDTQQGNPR